MILKTYSKASSFPGGLHVQQLSDSVGDSNHVSGFTGITVFGDNVHINGSSIADEQGLDSTISAHTPDYTIDSITDTVVNNKNFADGFMQTLKEKNIQEGLSSIDQSAWVHSKLRKVDFTLSDNTTVVQIDIMNLVIIGDIETAEYVLAQMSPDSMTESYHWFTQQRIDWIRNEIRSYLGWPLI